MDAPRTPCLRGKSVMPPGGRKITSLQLSENLRSGPSNGYLACYTADMLQPFRPSPSRLRRLRAFSLAAAALLETMMAMGIGAVFLSGAYAANSRVWSLLRASLEANAASRVLNGRSEQIRASTWDQITDANFLNTSIMSVAPDTNGDLSSLVETLDITAWPTPSPNPTPMRVTRDYTTGIVTTVGSGDGTMNAQTSIRINITAAWTAKGGQPRTKQISLILSEGGVTGRH